MASFAGKIELETFEEGRESRVTDDLTRRAVLRIFGSRFDVDQLDRIVTAFDMGHTAKTSSEKPAAEYMALLEEVDGLADAVKQLTSDERAEVVASAVDFILEGLHLNRRLNCERTSSGYLYRR